MEEKNIEAIKTIVQEFMNKMGFEAKIEVKNTTQEEKKNVVCDINVNQDSNLLIGQYGINLQALQHIIRLIIRKEMEDKLDFIIDVNSYRQEKNRSVIEQAHNAAQQALTEGRAIVLRPMSPYERRLIHMELSKNDKVTTESIGEEENRKVVIKPASTSL